MTAATDQRFISTSLTRFCRRTMLTRHGNTHTLAHLRSKLERGNILREDVQKKTKTEI